MSDYSCNEKLVLWQSLFNKRVGCSTYTHWNEIDNKVVKILFKGDVNLHNVQI